MSLDIGSRLTLDVERPVAGGWMLARHLGQVVFVGGAIPGERVVARVDRVARGTVYAEVLEVSHPSPDRRPGIAGRCGGTLYGHIAYERQVQLKAAVIEDAWRRLARQPLPASPVTIVASPERGYRTRARLHVEGHRLGFYQEGTHVLCDVGSTGQLSDATVDWLLQVQRRLEHVVRPGGVTLELVEDLQGTTRACHVELSRGADPDQWSAILDDACGISVGESGVEPRRGSAGDIRFGGDPAVVDELVVHDAAGQDAGTVRLRHHVRSFFQSNRFLLPGLVHRVVEAVLDGAVLDLYAGTGLFGLAVATARERPVTLVEGDTWSGRDLLDNARAHPRATVSQDSVERFLARRYVDFPTWIVDPPRQGLTADVRGAIVRDRPSRLVYVSCDVATLARDVAALAAGGYVVRSLVGLDMFPSTAHVEAVCVLDASGRRG